MLTYPDTTNTTRDLYDIAYEWGWKTPEMRQLVYLCFKTPNFFDNARRFYESPEFQAEVQVLVDLGKPPDRENSVLDLGCGNGVATYALARAGYSATGVDSSLGEIAGLNAARKIQGLDGVHFEIQHSTGEKLKFPDCTFDVVWIREALHHMHNLPAFLTEMRRILKPGGLICCMREIVVWNERQRANYLKHHPFYPITHDEGAFLLQEYLSAFEQAGLTMERVIDPVSSVMNTYPGPCVPGAKYEPAPYLHLDQHNDLFSFFARKRINSANALSLLL